MLRGPESSGLQQQQQQEQEPEAGTSNGIAKNNGDPKSGGSRAKILAEQRRQQRNVAASKILPTLSRSTSETETSSLLAPRRSSVTGGPLSYGSIPHHQLPDHLFNQEIIIDDELTVNVTGYRRSTVRLFFYRLLCVLSLGVVYIVCRWFPALELNITSVRCPMNAAELVSVKNQWGEVSIEQVHRDPFDGGYVADIFPNHPEPSHNGDTSESRSNTPRQPLSTIIYFDYRYIKFIFNPNTGLFETTQYWQDPEWTSVDGVLEGVSNTLLLSRRRLIFGENEVIIAEKPTFRLLVDEVLHPFFIFQVLSMLLWCLDEYYYYAACIFFITVISTTSTLLETKETMRRLRDMSRFTCNVRVWRGGSWFILKSEELIPGDIFEITPSGYLPIVPCDAILLDGDCIVNESMLTGESVPVSKTSITDAELNDIDFEEEDPANSNRMARYFLFSGTKVIRARCGTRLSGSGPSAPDPDAGLHFSSEVSEPGALALVVRVGFNTTKGALVRSILFPKPNTFMFYRDSFRFIGVLGLVAFFGFLASLYNFIKLGNTWQTIVVRALDLITIVVPPALPATMAVGTSFAIARLRRGLIYCTSPPRVNICGKIEAMCFDKTGTLTMEGLDVLGFRFTVPSEPVDFIPLKHSPLPSPQIETAPHQLHRPLQHTPSQTQLTQTPLRFSDIYRSVEDVLDVPDAHSLISPQQDNSYAALRRPSFSSVRLASFPCHPNGAETDFPYPMIVCAMAVCHSIKVVDSTLIGDPMDIRMFEFTGWDLEEGGNLYSEGASSNASSPKPSREDRGLGSGSLISMVVRPPGDLGFKDVMSTADRAPSLYVNGNAHTPVLDEPRVYTELGVIRSFEFVSSLRRMSVVVRRLRYSKESLNFGNPLSPDGVSTSKLQAALFGQSPPSYSPKQMVSHSDSPPPMNGVLRTLSTGGAMKEFEVFVKGAPEVMKSICNPASLPPNYDSLLKSYAHHGYRVIAVAWRRLENVAWVKVMRMKREDIEKNLDFLGFIVFENKLKPGTTPIVRELKTASIRQIMCTGDNVLTAISVSRECGLVEPTSKVFVPRFETKEFVHSEVSKVVWEDVDYEEEMASLPVMTLDPVTLKPLSLPPSSAGRNGEVVVPVEFDYSLAVTGDVFQWMLEYANQDSFRRMLVKGQIFARMSPEQKQILVERLQEIGYCVGFCGDGANDCGALKAADVGLSLSEAEASVAAPFTSKSTEIDCVTRVIREGRAALVTSFSCFKYMAVYSLIQFTSVSLLYSLASSLADFQFMFIDMGLIIPVAVFMSESGAHPKLDRKRPTASLVGKKVLSSMLGQVVIQAVFQGLIFWWVRTTEWYIPTRTDVSEKKMRCHENSVVFLLSCFQYVAVAMAFCSGPPYRESVWKNTRFVATILIILTFLIYLTLHAHPFTTWIFDLMPIPFHGRLQILAFAAANLGVTFFSEYLVLPFVSKAVGWVGVYARVCLDARERGTGVAVRSWVKRRRWGRKGKVFKVVLDEMGN